MTFIEAPRIDGQMWDDPAFVDWANVQAAFQLHLMIDLGPNTESVVIKPDRIVITRVREDENGTVSMIDREPARQVTEVGIRYAQATGKAGRE